MAESLQKHLERAEKLVSKGKVEPAIEAYQLAVQLAPQQLELLHTLGDLCLRANKMDQAQEYYGELFDKYVERGEINKALPLFRKSLKGSPQPASRYFKLGQVLQRSGKEEEAAETFRQALNAFRQEGNSQAVVECLDRLSSLDPENPEIQIQLGEQANRLGRAEVAAKAFLRAGQLLETDHPDRALELLDRARELAPGERAVTLHYAKALINKGESNQAVVLLQPLYAESEQDPSVLQALAEGLIGERQLPEAEKVLESLARLQPVGTEKLFDLAGVYCKENQALQAVEVLRRLKDRLFEARRQKEFLDRLEALFNRNPTAIPLAEFAARVFNEVNQESRYGAILGRLFQLHVQAQEFGRATEVLERLIDLDPYDLHHQKRLEQVKGKVQDSRYHALTARLTGAPPLVGPAVSGVKSAEKQDAAPRSSRAMLEDMIVQAEIFLQYSLKAKAIEKLQRVYELFPGEELQNERLYKLFELAQYFPPGFGSPPQAAAPAAAAPSSEAAVSAPTATATPSSPTAGPPPPVSGVDMARDLAKISEITHSLYREGSTKMLLHKAVSEVGKYLHVSHCLGVLGRPLTSPSAAVEYCAPGVPRSPAALIAKLLELLSHANLDPESGTGLDPTHPELKPMGAQSLFALPIGDKEKQERTGVFVLSQTDAPRHWQPNEIYFLKAVADQVEIAASHLKLRSLMKTLSVADHGTGLLGRSSYIDALTSEVARAKAQGTPLVVTLLELDKGTQLLRRLGEDVVQKFMQQASETLLSQMRPNDVAFRYTATAIAWVLVDTTADKVKGVVERLRKQLNGMKLPSLKDGHSFCAGISEAAIRPDYDPVDIVTDVINRAEFSLEDARKRGNTTVTR